MATKEEIVDKIAGICETFLHEIETLSKYDRVSHLSQSKIQFQGGILGGIREYKESKRLEKLINQPLVGEYSFYKYAFHIIEQAETLTSLILEYQRLVGKDTEEYYAPIEPAINTTMMAISTWYNLSPDMAEASIKIGDEKNIALAPTVKGWVKDNFAKIDLPESYSSFKKTDSQNSGSGCFGTLLLLVTAATGVVASLVIIL